MHLTVGYLATPTGDDGVALASALAQDLRAPPSTSCSSCARSSPTGIPAAPSTSSCSSSKGEEWIARAVSALADGRRHGEFDGAGRRIVRRVADPFAEEKSSDLIVVGGARDGFFGGHTIGPVTGALLHSSPIPVALAPRGYAEDPDDAITAITAAVPTRPGDDNPLPFAITLASAADLSIRMLSLVSAENLAEAGQRRARCASSRSTAAEENLEVAARALPDAPGDRVAGRRRHDAGVGAEEAQLERRRSARRRAPAGSPRRDGSSSGRRPRASSPASTSRSS